MKIYQKLLTLSAIPLIAYFFMCFVYAKDNFEEQNTISNMSKNAKLFVAASDLIHELQRERGRTSIYLSGGPRIAVDERRKASDVKIPIFIESSNTSSLPEQDKAKAPQIISKLESIRKQVDNNKNDKEAVNVYTEIISHLIGIESTIGNAKTTRGFGKALTTIITLEAAKESAGRLRAFTSGILTANLPITENQLSRLIGLKASIDTNLGSQSLALGKDSKSFFLEAQKSPEWELTNKALNTIMSKYKDGNFDFDSNSFFNSISKAIDDLGKVREIEINFIQKKLNEIEEDISSALTRMFLTIAMVTIIVVLATYFLSKSILKPINEIINYAKNISQGNLSSELNSNFSQEMEALKLSLLDMVSRLKDKIAESEKSKSEAIKQTDKAFIAMKEAEDAKQKAIDAKAEGMNEAANKLEGTIEIITSASEELSAQIEQSTRGAEIQSTRVSETATAMEEMNSTVLEVASNASSASQTADQAKNKANSGAKVVTLVVESIDEVQKTAIELKSNMTTLGKQAEGIGQILNVISDIADQTNLLALNAAIEAARAGDAGRGFAVVADEVRKLAEKTMTATKEVGEAIRGIQDVARINTENVDHAVEKIESATKLANQSGVELQSIVSLVDLTTDQIRSIATAAEQQSATSEQINRSVDDVNRIASETAGAMRESSQAITELARQAIALKNLVEKMKSDS